MTSLPQRAEVVIVGGGFAGAATAYELGRAGIGNILLLEREDTCGHHASGRNAALGRQLVEDELFTDLTLSGAAFLRDPPRDFASTPLLRPTGSIILSNSEPILAALSRRAARRELAVRSIGPEALFERLNGSLPAPKSRGIHAHGRWRGQDSLQQIQILAYLASKWL